MWALSLHYQRGLPLYQHIAAVREDDSEEISENIKGNLKEDATNNVSEEGEIPPKEEENLNESSDEDEEMYSWDELEYKANYVRFISNEDTEQQMWVASAAIDKLEEPIYNHRTNKDQGKIQTIVETQW